MTRSQGIPQGNVLGPALMNLHLTPSDRVIARTVANLGCRVWRYSDDYLVFGPDAASVQQSIDVIRRELQRLRLVLKPKTCQVRDLSNPQNPACWLGYSFTLTSTWVPRERIEKKAAELLMRLVGGRLTPDGLKDVLDHIRSSHRRILHPEDADRAASAIQRLLAPYTTTLTTNTEDAHPDPFRWIRNQLRHTTSHSWDQPARVRGPGDRQITLGTNPKGHAQDIVPACTPPGGSVTSPLGTSALVTPEQSDRQPTSCPVMPLLVERGTRGSCLSEEASTALDTTPPLITKSSLAAPAPRCAEPPRPEQANLRDGDQCKTVHHVYCSVHKGTIVRVRIVSGSTEQKLRATDRTRRSHEEKILCGYRSVLRRIPAGPVCLHFRHPTLVGQVYKRHRIRSPALMREWELLLAAIDRRGDVSASRDAACRTRDRESRPETSSVA